MHFKLILKNSLGTQFGVSNMMTQAYTTYIHGHHLLYPDGLIFKRTGLLLYTWTP